MVIDRNTSRIQVFNSAGVFIERIADGLLNYPHGITFNNEGNLVITDTNNQRVHILTTNGVVLLTFGGDAGFANPTSVAVDADGNIYVTDGDIYNGNNQFPNSKVIKFDKNGAIVRKWSVAGNAFGQFRKPMGILVAPNNNILVSDNGNSRIQEFTRTEPL